MKMKEIGQSPPPWIHQYNGISVDDPETEKNEGKQGRIKNSSSKVFRVGVGWWQYTILLNFPKKSHVMEKLFAITSGGSRIFPRGVRQLPKVL